MGAPVLKERSFFEEYVGTCFIDACVKTTETYFSMPASKTDHTIAADHKVDYPVGAYINFTADLINVQLTLAFNKEFSIEFYNKMLGENKTEFNDDVLDCISELTNIIYGLAKAPLVNLGHSFSPARPKATNDINSVLLGKKSLEIKFKLNRETPQFSLILSI